MFGRGSQILAEKVYLLRTNFYDLDAESTCRYRMQTIDSKDMAAHELKIIRHKATGYDLADYQFLQSFRGIWREIRRCRALPFLELLLLS